MPIHRLVVMRHATAQGAAASDRDRELTTAGRREAASAGTWLREVGVTPDRALVSSARRTRTSWACVTDAVGWQDLPVDFEDVLYEAGTASALELLRGLPESCGTGLLLGHNPTASDLVQLLDDGAGPAEPGTAVMRGFPPASVAVLDVDRAWSELDEAGATLREFRPGERAW